MTNLFSAPASALRALIKPLGGDLKFTREDVPGLQGTGTGVEYWSEGLERRMPRYWELTWRGRVQRVADWYTQRRNPVHEPFELRDVRTVECLIALDAEQTLPRLGQRVRVTIMREAR